MAKYHINPRTGNPNACKAAYKCPFGDLHEAHYDTKEEARKAYEASMNGDDSFVEQKRTKAREKAKARAREILAIGYNDNSHDLKEIEKIEEAGGYWRLDSSNEAELYSKAGFRMAFVSEESPGLGDDLAEDLVDEETGTYGYVNWTKIGHQESSGWGPVGKIRKTVSYGGERETFDPADIFTYNELARLANAAERRARELRSEKNSFVREARAADAKRLQELTQELRTASYRGLTRSDVLFIKRAVLESAKHIEKSDNKFVRDAGADRVASYKKLADELQATADQLKEMGFKG